MRVLDLFCGIGGWSLAAERAGHTVVGAYDTDSNRLAVYKVNLSRAPTKADLFALQEFPEADLWILSQPVRRALAFCPAILAHAPQAVLIESAADPFDVLEEALAIYSPTVFVAGGRRFLLGGATITSVEFKKSRPPSPTRYEAVEDAEEAQGFPRGYTAVCGAKDTRQRALYNSVDLNVATEIMRRIAF